MEREDSLKMSTIQLPFAKRSIVQKKADIQRENQGGDNVV